MTDPQAVTPAPPSLLPAGTANGPPASPPAPINHWAALRAHRWALLAGLVILLLAGWGTWRWWRGPLLVAETVQRRDFVQTVVASGHVEAPHRIDIGAQITGTVVAVPVREGQAVSAGQVLIELASAELRATALQATLAVQQAQGKLRQMNEVQAPVAEQAVLQAQAGLDNARATQQRNQALVAQGFLSEAALGDGRKAVDQADAQLRTTQRQLATARPSGSDYALGQAGVAAAQATLQAAQARTGYTLIRAPVAGSLIGRAVEVGDVVQAGKVLMTLSPQGGTQLVVEIDEKNLHLLRLGQQAVVSSDAYATERFAAVLAYINPGVNAATGAVEVKLDVPHPPATLRQDMTVSIDIEVARRPQALLVSSGAVHDATTTAPWVLLVQQGRAVRRPVRLGLASAGISEVLAGLQAGDAVLPAQAAVAAGDRLRRVDAAKTPTPKTAP